MAPLVSVIIFSFLTAFWASRSEADEGQRIGDVLFTQTQGDWGFDFIVRSIIGMDPAGLRSEKGINLGKDPLTKMEVDCSGDDETGLGLVSMSVVKCDLKNVHVDMPAPAPGNANFTRSDYMLWIDEIFLHLDCMPVGHLLMHVTGETIGNLFGRKDLEYKGKPLCDLKELKINNITVFYESAVTLSGTNTRASVFEFAKSNVDQFIKMFPPPPSEKAPEKELNQEAGTDPVNWKDLDVQVNEVNIYWNGKRVICGDAVLNHDLKHYIGSAAKDRGVTRLLLGLLGDTSHLLFDTTYCAVGGAVASVFSSIADATTNGLARVAGHVTGLSRVAADIEQ